MHHKANPWNTTRKKELSSSAVRLWVKDNIRNLRFWVLNWATFYFFNELSKKQQQPPGTVLALTEVKFECKRSSSGAEGVESLPRVPVPVERVAPTLLTLRVQWVLSRIKLPPHLWRKQNQGGITAQVVRAATTERLWWPIIHLEPPLGPETLQLPPALAACQEPNWTSDLPGTTPLFFPSSRAEQTWQGFLLPAARAPCPNRSWEPSSLPSGKASVCTSGLWYKQQAPIWNVSLGYFRCCYSLHVVCNRTSGRRWCPHPKRKQLHS